MLMKEMATELDLLVNRNVQRNGKFSAPIRSRM